MFEGIENRFIFPAPTPSYCAQSYKRHLCWIPWNPVISPQRVKDPNCTEGIPCLWFTAPRAATVILFFHANAEDLGMSYGVIKHMRDQFKVNVLAVEYPGYGLLSQLKPTEEAVYEVALTAFRFLFDEVKVRYSQIVLFGRSLGSGAAVHLASQYPVGGLVLVSAFSSIRGAVQSIAGSLLAWSVKEHFPNIQLISNVSCSTLIIHGENDALIPVEHSLRLFKKCRARKLLVTPPTMDHNSNLFAEASFLAVPAIHFFGFPGFSTANPPKLPTHLFEASERRPIVTAQEDTSYLRQGLCGCLAKQDPHHLDVKASRTEMRPSISEHRAGDITITFGESNEDGNANIPNSSWRKPPATVELDPVKECPSTSSHFKNPGATSASDMNSCSFQYYDDKVECEKPGEGLKENIDEIQRQIKNSHKVQKPEKAI